MKYKEQISSILENVQNSLGNVIKRLDKNSITREDALERLKNIRDQFDRLKDYIQIS